MFLKDVYGNEIEVLEGIALSEGDKVVIVNDRKSNTIISHIPTRKYIIFTIKQIIQNGERVKTNEMGGSWLIDLVYKVNE